MSKLNGWNEIEADDESVSVIVAHVPDDDDTVSDDSDPTGLFTPTVDDIFPPMDGEEDIVESFLGAVEQVERDYISARFRSVEHRLESAERIIYQIGLLVLVGIIGDAILMIIQTLRS